MKRTYAIAVLCACVLASRASAQETTDPPAAADVAAQARGLFEQGVIAFDAERYEEALELFERSHALRASPLVLYNIAVAHRRLGQPREALERLRAYLDTAEPGDGRRELILLEIEELAAQIGPPSPPEPPPPEPEPPSLPEVVAAPVPPPRTAPFGAPPRAAPADTDGTIWESPWTWVAIAAVLLGGAAAAWLVLHDAPESVEGNFDPPVVMALGSCPSCR